MKMISGKEEVLIAGVPFVLLDLNFDILSVSYIFWFGL